MGWVRRRAGVAIGLACGLWAPAKAHAVDNACFDAYESTQRLRNGGKVTEAREQALICARAACPQALQKDCARWRDELTQMLATVVFSARDENGQALPGASVYVDDRRIDGALDGRQVTLDPGPHKVRWESGDRKVESIVQLAAGETDRHVEGTLAPPPSTIALRRIPTVSLVLGAVAGVGLVSFVSFAAAGRVEQGCSPRCVSGQISTLRAEYAVADASWITGLAALGTGIAFWLLKPSSPTAGTPAARTGTLHLEAIPSPGGARFGVGGEF